MPSSPKLRKLSKEQFINLGLKRYCYLKVVDIGDDEESYILYNADGTHYAQRYSRESALDLLESNNITLLNVH